MLARAAGCALLGAALLMPAGVAAQFRSDVDVVELYATVIDSAGNPVLGLGRQDFVVEEDGARQEIATFVGGEFPLSAALAIDRSFSMSGRRLAAAKSAARLFLGQLRSQDESMVIGIGSATEVIAPLSTDRASQYDALTKLDAFGTTGLHDAIITAIEAIQQTRGRRALVLLSDGSDRYSTASAADALTKARTSDVLIYPVALGRERPTLFSELAALTGGRSLHVPDPGELPSALRGVAQELRTQYLIGYSPTKPIVAGQNAWRAIRVSVVRQGVRVRARDGYVAR